MQAVKARPFPIPGLDKSLALAVLRKSHTGNLFVCRAARGRNFNQIPTNMFERGNVRFIAAGDQSNRTTVFAQGMSGLLFKPVATSMDNTIQLRGSHVCCAVTNRSRDNGSDCLSPRAYSLSGCESFSAGPLTSRDTPYTAKTLAGAHGSCDRAGRNNPAGSGHGPRTIC
jgi:hypothetical protein